jgi:hypothetical protein
VFTIGENGAKLIFLMKFANMQTGGKPTGILSNYAEDDSKLLSRITVL